MGTSKFKTIHLPSHQGKVALTVHVNATSSRRKKIHRRLFKKGGQLALHNPTTGAISYPHLCTVAVVCRDRRNLIIQRGVNGHSLRKEGIRVMLEGIRRGGFTEIWCESGGYFLPLLDEDIEMLENEGIAKWQQRLED